MGQCYPSSSVTAKRCRDYAETAPGLSPRLGVSLSRPRPFCESSSTPLEGWPQAGVVREYRITTNTLTTSRRSTPYSSKGGELALCNPDEIPRYRGMMGIFVGVKNYFVDCFLVSHCLFVSFQC